tara:strand:- start:7824 stop:8462 length:639 start_codon:yes stop_codon:yes gene_type:complete
MAQGVARFLRERGMERAREGKSRNFDVSQASRARSIEQERKGIGSLVGSIVLGSIFGPAGIVAGTTLGKVFGGAMTVDNKAAEDYKIRTDVGKFDVSEAYDIADINRSLEAADRADVWSDVVDIGKSAALAFTLGGGSMKDPSDFSFKYFGGKKAAAEGMYGQGLFRTPAGQWEMGSGSLWGHLTGKPSIYQLPTVTSTAMRGRPAQSGGTV